ncbi:MAG: two pore domain potassium channel family protein [Deltaproteobacteria bacterium]|nr:MAG: two pore domain potassium channel family protein [Deltaproteobacteria bacterium]
MPEEIYIPFTRIRVGRFLLLFVSILLLLILRPFLEGRIGIHILMDIFVTFVLISGVYAVSESRAVFIGGIILVVPALATQWMTHFVSIPGLDIMNDLTNILFFGYTAIIILSYLLGAREITAEVIMAAVCTYFLIGFVWALGYSLLEAYQPGSFSIGESPEQEPFHFFYYSFVTLTTLGFGDITPLTNPARSLSLVEATIGQIYIAVLIARLVGIHISQSLDRGSG